jgi:hypothetical protein
MGTWVALIPSPGALTEHTKALAVRAERTLIHLRGEAIVSRETLPWGWLLHTPRGNGQSFDKLGDATRGALIAGAWVRRSDHFSKLSDPADFDGQFAQIAWSPDTITLGTDPIGSLHLYVFQTDFGLLVSTSAVVIAALVEVPLHGPSLAEFITLGSVYGNKSLFEGVKKVAPAQRWTFAKTGAVSRETYWSVKDALPYVTARQATEQLADSTQAVLKKIVARYPKPISDLTGGFDSRALFAATCASEIYPALTVSGLRHEPDVFIAQQLADHIGKQELRVIARPRPTRTAFERSALMTDGEFDGWEFASIAYIHANHAKDFSVSLNGSFGEVARGYWWELLWPNVTATKNFPFQKVAAGRYAAASAGDAVLAPAFRLNLTAHFTQLMGKVCDDMRGAPAATVMDAIYLRLRMQRWQGRIASSTAQIWPTLSPFGCRDPLTAMLSAPPSQRIRSGMARDFISYLAPDLARIPLEQGSPAERFTWNNAHRFLPLVSHYGQKVQHKLRPPTPAPTERNVPLYETIEEIGRKPHTALAPFLNPAGWNDAMNQAGVTARRLLTVQTVLNKIDAAR